MIGEQFAITYPEGALDVVQADVLPAIQEAGLWHGETTGLRADGTTFVEDHRLAETDEGSILCSVLDKTEATTHERAIEGLHSTVQGLMRADSPADVADVTVSAVETVLDLPANTVYRYEGATDRLEPVAWTDGVEDVAGSVEAVDRDGGVVWTVYETGEGQLHDDVAVPEHVNPSAPFRSELLLPLGAHGVLAVRIDDPDAVDETDVALVRTLAAHATTALDGIQSERELREEREFVDQAIAALNDVFFVLGTDGGIRRWNDRLCEVSGQAEETLEGTAIRDFFAEADRELVADAVAETLERGQSTFEAALLTADGERVPYEFASARLTDTDGTVTGVVGIGRDVSKRKAHERELERQNERLDEFASMVSHDLRNPLNVAQGRLEMALEASDDENLEAVERAHDRMATLIDDVLSAARDGEAATDVEAVRLADAVEACWSHVETHDATLRCRADRTVEADRNQLGQLLENCVRNAVEHGGRDVTVTVGSLPDGFFVEDDGPGVPPDERDRVFDPGYSGTADGTGLGLNIVAGVAEAHGWSVSVSAGESGGARFEFSGIRAGR